MKKAFVVFDLQSFILGFCLTTHVSQVYLVIISAFLNFLSPSNLSSCCTFNCMGMQYCKSLLKYVNLLKGGLIDIVILNDSSCLWVMTELLDLDHLFLQCPKALMLWHRLFQLPNISWVASSLQLLAINSFWLLFGVLDTTRRENSCQDCVVFSIS